MKVYCAEEVRSSRKLNRCVYMLRAQAAVSDRELVEGHVKSCDIEGAENMFNVVTRAHRLQCISLDPMK